MSQATELLDSLNPDDVATYSATSDTEEHIVIGDDRFITVPNSLKRIAVQFDHNVETITFDCPRYWDNLDMSEMIVYINVMLPNGDPYCYVADNVRADGDIMHFDWTIKNQVTQYNGALAFLVCVKQSDDNGDEVNHWNTELNRDMYISEGMECQETVLSKYPDLVAKILTRLTAVEESIATGGGGTTDYTHLLNKPRINGIELLGDIDFAALGVDVPIVDQTFNSSSKNAQSGHAIYEYYGPRLDNMDKYIRDSVAHFDNSIGIRSDNSVGAYQESEKDDTAVTLNFTEVLDRDAQLNYASFEYNPDTGKYDIENKGTYDRQSQTGQNATSLGSSIATGKRSFAAGSSNIAAAEKAFVTGCDNIVAGKQSFANGYANYVESSSSAVFGQQSIVKGACSFVAGLFCKALGMFSTVFGNSNVANHPNQFVVGKFNNNKSDTVFEVGYGGDENSRANLFEVGKNWDTNDNFVRIGDETLTENDLKKLLALSEGNSASSDTALTLYARRSDYTLYYDINCSIRAKAVDIIKNVRSHGIGSLNLRDIEAPNEIYETVYRVEISSEHSVTVIDYGNASFALSD